VNKFAYEKGVEQALLDMGFTKESATRASEIMLGPLSAGLNKDPNDTYGKALGRSALQGTGALVGGAAGLLGGGGLHKAEGVVGNRLNVSAKGGRLQLKNTPIKGQRWTLKRPGLGMGLGLAGMLAGGIGGRLLGEKATGYDAERGY
jgi:hypothetical protein